MAEYKLSLPTDKIIVLVAVDGSDFSHHALKWYISTLYQPTFHLQLVHCVEPLSVIGEVTSPEAYERVLEGSKLNADDIAKRYKTLLKDYNVQSGDICTIYGNRPGEALVDMAKKVKAGMVVVGSRGLSKVRRTMLGSVSDYLVHHSHCPVIVSRDPNRDTKFDIM